MLRYCYRVLLFFVALASIESPMDNPLNVPGTSYILRYPKFATAAFLRVQAWAAPAPGLGLPRVRYSGGQGHV